MRQSKRANALLSAIVLACFGQLVNVVGQYPPLSGCNGDHKPPINKPGWTQGTRVDVWIDPAITGQRRDKVKAAFDLWSLNNAANGTGVTYNTNVTTEPPDEWIIR